MLHLEGQSMIDNIFTVLLGLLGGISVGIQSPIVSGMSRRIGSAGSTLIVHLSGTIFSVALLVLRGGENFKDWNTLPWYMLASGGFGLVVLLALSHTLPRIGAAATTTLIIIGQLVIGMVIDHFGWFETAARPMDVGRIVAVVLLLIGGYLMVR
jgi:bacterial/archaeal transporter family-2 protein